MGFRPFTVISNKEPAHNYTNVSSQGSCSLDWKRTVFVNKDCPKTVNILVSIASMDILEIGLSIRPDNLDRSVYTDQCRFSLFGENVWHGINLSFEQFDLNYVKTACTRAKKFISICQYFCTTWSQNNTKWWALDSHVRQENIQIGGRVYYVVHKNKNEKKGFYRSKEHFCWTPIFLYLLHLIDSSANIT